MAQNETKTAKNPSVQLEWLFEALEKRVSNGVKLQDLFLCVPWYDEAEFDYELASAFKLNSPGNLASQGNVLERDYPNLARIIKSSRKESSLKIFFVCPTKLSQAMLLHKRRYNYPKISLIKVQKSYGQRIIF